MKSRQNVANVLKRLWVKVMAKSSATKTKQVKVTLVKSIYGQLKSHQGTINGLGLRRIRDSRVLADTPEIRGMIRSALHLLLVEEL